MTKTGIRIRLALWLVSFGVFGQYAVGVLNAQVRKCYAEVCTTTSDGKKICMETEVKCPNEEDHASTTP